MTTILHAIETGGPGGAERMLVSLVEHLDRARYEPLVCLLKDGWLNGQLERRGIETVIVPQKRGLDRDWLRSFMSLIKRRRVAVMHAQEFTMNTACSIASAMTGVPLVTTVQGKNYYPDKWRRRAAYRFASKQSRMVAVSDDLKRFLVEQVGIKPRRVTTIYNGIDARDHIFDNGGRWTFRKELGLDDRQPVIGTVGNLYPVKGHVHLLKAMASIVRDLPRAVCLIAGRGELEAELRQMAASLGIERNVRLLGFREDVPDLLRASDVFVLPSLSEGLSLALLEAMAAAKPVVVTAVGGNPEVVEEGRTGFLVPAGDPAALADRLALLLRDAELADRMGRCGRARFEQEFSVTTMVEKYDDLYRACLGAESAMAPERSLFQEGVL